MKKYIISTLALVMALASCDRMDYPDRFRATEGKPVIYSVRYSDRDQTITQAFMKETVCILGENLKSVNQVWFNDQQAVLNTSFMTTHTLIVDVPGKLPVNKTDKLYLITAANDTTAVDFKVLAPAPKLTAMTCEYAKAGETVTLFGDFFVEPLTVTFAGGAEAKVSNVTMGTMDVVIPADAQPGRIKVETASGLGQSTFEYLDNRGIITNFDGEGNSGTKGIVPQGWNLAVTYPTDGGIDGAYAQVGPADLDEDGSWQEALKISWWCGNWGGDPMSIKEGAGVPLRNIFPAGYFDSPSDLAIKFELFIPSSNPWKSGSMQIVFANNLVCANDSWQNNTYIQDEDNGGPNLCRGLYTPWKDAGSFDTGDKWITVTIPISEFTYGKNGEAGKVSITPESFDSFTIWPMGGGVKGEACSPIFRYDNIRIVPVK